MILNPVRKQGAEPVGNILLRDFWIGHLWLAPSSRHVPFSPPLGALRWNQRSRQRSRDIHPCLGRRQCVHMCFLAQSATLDSHANWSAVTSTFSPYRHASCKRATAMLAPSRGSQAGGHRPIDDAGIFKSAIRSPIDDRTPSRIWHHHVSRAYQPICKASCERPKPTLC